MISVPWHERVIYLRYDIALSCDDICLRHMRNGYYIMLAKQVLSYGLPYIISRQRYIIEKHNALGSQNGL